ncbi:hypothetical protein K505DRAFT_360986 [Melanomma pulvis-pyrius CBS 109.77]|uniref:Uncharacterized protein n=1 Tax=Melanomma pulvis-pyrius CBS 109.77 TaxID=1314802 RepID=A0A6A6XDN3_9PLEO|nr:hypothetical protein K505DRAFT_360986 [Melanomma pulvis-pyrius CBS 109.77]
MFLEAHTYFTIVKTKMSYVQKYFNNVPESGKESPSYMNLVERDRPTAVASAHKATGETSLMSFMRTLRATREQHERLEEVKTKYFEALKIRLQVQSAAPSIKSSDTKDITKGGLAKTKLSIGYQHVSGSHFRTQRIHNIQAEFRTWWVVQIQLLRK